MLMLMDFFYRKLRHFGVNLINTQTWNGIALSYVSWKLRDISTEKRRWTSMIYYLQCLLPSHLLSYFTRLLIVGQIYISEPKLWLLIYDMFWSPHYLNYCAVFYKECEQQVITLKTMLSIQDRLYRFFWEWLSALPWKNLGILELYDWRCRSLTEFVDKRILCRFTSLRSKVNNPDVVLIS